MAEKKFSGAPFGCQSSRFDVSAVHPAFKKPGTYTEAPYCRTETSELKRRLGPGMYNDDLGDFSPAAIQKKVSGPGWKRAEETARLKEMPHLLYKETWDRIKLLNQNMGPGRYNIKSFVELMAQKPSSIHGVCSTRNARFKTDQKDCNPGPGSYGKGGNPYWQIEEKAAHPTSARGIMDSGTIKHPAPQSTGCDLGPGTYNLKSSIDEVLSHVVGKRGPYDLLSGSRAQPVLYGHFASPKIKESEPGAYKIKSFTEELENEQNKKHGLFGKIPQYPEVPAERMYHSSLAHYPRPANFPGPGSYETKTIFVKKNQSVPFLSSAKRFDHKASRLLFGCSNPVGVGRYDVTKHLRSNTTGGSRASFLSKSARSLSNLERDKLLQERIQPRHVSACNEKIFGTPLTA